MINAEKIWKSQNLPTLPAVAVELIALNRSPDVSAAAIADVIRNDPAITMKVVRAVNSVHFGLSRTVGSLNHAVSLLGTHVVSSLALSFSLVDDAIREGAMREHYQEAWVQSAVQATAAEVFAPQIGFKSDTDPFFAGLVTEIGRLAMLKTVPREYFPVLEAAREEQRPLAEVEQAILGITHGDVSRRLIETWKLPKELAKATGFQDSTISAAMSEYGSEEGRLGQLVLVSSAVGDYFCSAAKGVALYRLRALCEGFWGWTPAVVESKLQELRHAIDATGEMLSVNTADLPNPQELLLEANEQLVNLAMRISVESAHLAAKQEVIEKQNATLQTEKAQLERASRIDPLTQVFNRRAFDESFHNAVEQARSDGELVGVVFVDIDHFKSLNDSYGHQFGDSVLARVADTLRSSCRDSDIVGRFGGEEFVILVYQPSEKGLTRFSERLRSAVAALELTTADGKSVRVTASFGAALTLPALRDSEVASRLVSEADHAMYDSKRNGRNQCHLRVLLSAFDQAVINASTQQRFSRWVVANGFADMRQASMALLKTQRGTKRFGEVAISVGLLTPDQVAELIEDQATEPYRLGELANRRGWLAPQQIAHIIARQAESPIDVAACLVEVGAFSHDQAKVIIHKYRQAHQDLLVPISAIACRA